MPEGPRNGAKGPKNRAEGPKNRPEGPGEVHDLPIAAKGWHFKCDFTVSEVSVTRGDELFALNERSCLCTSKAFAAVRQFLTARLCATAVY
jgi:hypothetical protein